MSYKEASCQWVGDQIVIERLNRYDKTIAPPSTATHQHKCRLFQGVSGGIVSAASPGILIVDDDEPAAKLLHMNLSRRGYRVVTASDGEQALHLLRSHRVDLVLLDVTLPGIDGITVCQQMQMISQSPILILSARAEERYRRAALNAGAADYIVKPFDWVGLFDRIDSMFMGTDGPL
jgi:CheY-like chemotaxis protein